MAKKLFKNFAHSVSLEQKHRKTMQRLRDKLQSNPNIHSSVIERIMRDREITHKMTMRGYARGGNVKRYFVKPGSFKPNENKERAQDDSEAAGCPRGEAQGSF